MDPNASVDEIKDGTTALIHACTLGNRDAVRSLLEQSADPNKEAFEPEVATIKAAVAAADAAAAAAGGGEDRTPNEGSNAAGGDGSDEVGVGVMLSPKFGGRKRRTPLMAASGVDAQIRLPVVEDQMAIIVLLLEANADISLGKSDTGATAIHIASQEGHTPIVKLLAENRAGIDTKTNDDGDHPVWIAAQNGHVDVILLLIQLGAKIDEATIDDGATPLYIAATQGHVEVLDVLADHGADIDTQCTDDGTTPLFKACQNQHLAVVRSLLARNADTTLATALEQGQGGGGFGFAPLHAAVQSGSNEIVEMLLDHGVEPGIVTTDMYEWSAVLLASYCGHDAILRLLRKHGADFESKTAGSEQFGAMFMAAQNGRASTIFLLAQYGVDVNQQSQRTGTLPLHAAAADGYREACEMLVACGASIDAKERTRAYTPKKFAEEHLSAGASPERSEDIRATIAWCALAESRKMNDRWGDLEYAAAFRLKEVAEWLVCEQRIDPIAVRAGQLVAIAKSDAPLTLRSRNTLPARAANQPPPLASEVAEPDDDAKQDIVARDAGIYHCAEMAEIDRDGNVRLIPYYSGAQPVDIEALAAAPVVADVVKLMRLLSSPWSPKSHKYYAAAFRRCMHTMMHVSQRLVDTELELPPEIWLYTLQFVNRADFAPAPAALVPNGLRLFPVLDEEEADGSNSESE